MDGIVGDLLFKIHVGGDIVHVQQRTQSVLAVLFGDLLELLDDDGLDARLGVQDCFKIFDILSELFDLGGAL